jgi:hypothetical protein
MGCGDDDGRRDDDVIMLVEGNLEMFENQIGTQNEEEVRSEMKSDVMKRSVNERSVNEDMKYHVDYLNGDEDRDG